MVHYYIYAKDYSGSTQGDLFYHDNGLKSLEEFKRDVENIRNEQYREQKEKEIRIESKIVYLHWGDRCWEVDENEARMKYVNMESGGMGTQPGCIIEYIKENNLTDENGNVKLLYIITDGLIGNYSAGRCFNLNENMYYETFVFHAFNKNPKAVDLSVAASFLKSRCKIYRNYELYGDNDISKEFNYSKINIDNFAVKKDELCSYIQFKYIKKLKHDVGALHEINKLKMLRDRLFVEMTSKISLVENRKLNGLDTRDRHELLCAFVNTEWYKNLHGADYLDKVYIENFISTLTNYIISETKCYLFEAMKFNTQCDRSVQRDMVDVNFLAEQEIAFSDIILENDKEISVIILTKLNLLNNILLNGIKQWPCQVSPETFSKFKSVMDCPLFLMENQDFRETVGYFYTLNDYKQFLANKTNTEPRTRRPFHGGIVLTDTDQFDRYNDYILSATYFDSKKISYNIGLFYYVLWKNCDNKEWMDRNVVEQFKKYTMRRISETVCKIGLSTFPQDPPTNTSLLTALWYCTELSSYIFKSDSKNFNHERLRMYYNVAPYMIEILKHFNYELDLKAINKRRKIINYVMSLKAIPKYREKVYYLLKEIFKSVDGFLVSQIEKPFNLYKLNYLKLNHNQMLPDDVIDEKVYLNDYIHLIHIQGDLDTSKSGEGTFPICKKTFRPYFSINNNKSFYTDLLNTIMKVVINNDHDPDNIEVTFEAIDSLEFDRVMSQYKLFIDCVQDLKKYPTLDEYVQYVFSKKKFHGNLVTIFPINVYYDLKNVFERYQEIVLNVEVEEFISVSGAYVSRNNRIIAEERVKYNYEYEISEFIANDEIKVNLRN